MPDTSQIIDLVETAPGKYEAVDYLFDQSHPAVTEDNEIDLGKLSDEELIWFTEQSRKSRSIPEMSKGQGIFWMGCIAVSLVLGVLWHAGIVR